MNSRTKLLSVVGAIALAVLGPSPGSAQVGSPIGQWDFENGDLSGTGTSPALTYIDVTETQFGLTSALGIPDIGGTAAKVMRFPKSDSFNGYTMPVNSAPNGGGLYVNQWT